MGKGVLTFYRRSFWLMNPLLNCSTTVHSMALASLAKSRSLISITGTETMAKASLSSLVGHVPSCRRSCFIISTLTRTRRDSPTYSPSTKYSHFQAPQGLLFLRARRTQSPNLNWPQGVGNIGERWSPIDQTNSNGIRISTLITPWQSILFESASFIHCCVKLKRLASV